MSTTPASSTNAGRTASGVRRILGRSAPTSAAALLTAAVLAALWVLADQATKNWAESALEEGVPRPLLGALLQLHLIYNSGAAWGMGAGATPIVTALQILIALAVLVFLLRGVRSWAWIAAMGCVLGGALGNIHDRLLRPPGPFHGFVVDFLQLPRWPIFNIADVAVVTGAVLVVLLTLLGVDAAPARGRRVTPGTSAPTEAAPREHPQAGA